MKKIYNIGLAVPALILYIFLFLMPCVMGFGYSFTNWNIVNFANPKIIGLENYITIFYSEKQTYLAPVWNTAVFAVVTAILKAAAGLFLAILLNARMKTKEALRGIFFMPYIIAPLIVGYVFSSILHPEGMLNGVLRFIGLGSLAHAWLTEMATAFPSVMFAEVWKMLGFNMVIFIAGLQMIPDSYYESASINGANAWHTFIKITLPCIMPSLIVNTIMNVISGFNAFDLIIALTNGGPGNVTSVLNTLIYTEYGSGRYGMASALGVVIILFTTVIAFMLQALMSRGKVESL